MTRYDRSMWRVTQLVRDRLRQRQENAAGGWVRLADDAMAGIERVQRLQRSLRLAQQRHFHAAAKRVRPQLARELQNLHRLLEPTIQHLARSSPPVPPMRELICELRALEDEFDESTIDRTGRTIAVRTEPITLEGVYLGPFEIRLYINELGDDGGPAPFSVVALDPRPAAGNDSITHPHVSDDRLCAGDATGPINRALETGRLCDFFLLVRSVLTTYNPSSPYVALEEWDGEPCGDCGVRTHEDNRCFCERCERDYCDQCITLCRGCDLAACHGCVSVCDVCNDPFCDHCLRRCAECDDAACAGCREGDLCVACFEHKETHDESESHQEEQPATSHAPSPLPESAEAGARVHTTDAGRQL